MNSLMLTDLMFRNTFQLQMPKSFLGAIDVVWRSNKTKLRLIGKIVKNRQLICPEGQWHSQTSILN
jgi:hypothetical protein